MFWTEVAECRRPCGAGRGTGGGSPVWLLVRRRLAVSWGLGHEEPLCTSGFCGCKPTLANFSQEGLYRKEMVASNRKFSEPNLLKIAIRNKWWS